MTYEEFTREWENRDHFPILTTVDKNGIPNSVYVGEIQLRDSGFVISDNYFCKTRENIKSGSSASVLFITKERKAYQVKGEIEYLSGGPVFEEMYIWHNPKHPGVAATVVKVTDVFCGADKLI